MNSTQELEAHITKLRSFAEECINRTMTDDSIDADDVQSLALQNGLLKHKLMQSACGPGCLCADYDKFPAQCLVKTKVLRPDGEEQPQ